jgi:hypothetical protein
LAYLQTPRIFHISRRASLSIGDRAEGYSRERCYRGSRLYIVGRVPFGHSGRISRLVCGVEVVVALCLGTLQRLSIRGCFQDRVLWLPDSPRRVMTRLMPLSHPQDGTIPREGDAGQTSYGASTRLLDLRPLRIGPEEGRDCLFVCRIGVPLRSLRVLSLRVPRSVFG